MVFRNLVYVITGLLGLFSTSHARDMSDKKDWVRHPCDEITKSYIDKAGHRGGNRNGRLNERLQGIALRCQSNHQGSSFKYGLFYEVGGMINSKKGDTLMGNVGIKVPVFDVWGVTGYVGAAGTLAYYPVPSHHTFRLLPFPSVFHGLDAAVHNRYANGVKETLHIGREEAVLPLGVKVRRVTLKYTATF